MQPALLLLVSLGLGAAVVLFLQRSYRSRLNPQGAVFLWFFPLAGALSVLPGFFLYAVADLLGARSGSGPWTEVLFVWTVNSPGEEAAKYLCFAASVTLLKSIREPQDGSLQGAATGLGFALVENVLYGLQDGWVLFAVRTFLSLPGHVIYGAVWGGYHGFETYQGKGRIVRPWVPLLALVPAAFSHALFNTLALVGAPLAVLLAGDLVTLGFGLFLYTRLRALSPSHRRRPLKEWRLAVPELEHALALDPSSVRLRRHLAAYHLAGRNARRALEVLAPLEASPWTQFYRDAALRQLSPSAGPPPPSSALAPGLFRALSGD